MSTLQALCVNCVKCIYLLSLSTSTEVILSIRPDIGFNFLHLVQVTNFTQTLDSTNVITKFTTMKVSLSFFPPKAIIEIL